MVEGTWRAGVPKEKRGLFLRIDKERGGGQSDRVFNQAVVIRDSQHALRARLEVDKKEEQRVHAMEVACMEMGFDVAEGKVGEARNRMLHLHSKSYLAGMHRSRGTHHWVR